MSCIIHNNILNINLIQVFYPYIKVSNKIIIHNQHGSVFYRNDLKQFKEKNAICLYSFSVVPPSLSLFYIPYVFLRLMRSPSVSLCPFSGILMCLLCFFSLPFCVMAFLWFLSRLSIPFRKVFYFFNWNGMFQFWSVSACRFGVVLFIYIYIYQSTNIIQIQDKLIIYYAIQTQCHK